MRATGWTRRDVAKLVLGEHAGLLIFAVVAGTVSGLPAVAPALKVMHRQLPLGTMAGLLALITVTGFTSLALGVHRELKRSPLDALRQE